MTSVNNVDNTVPYTAAGVVTGLTAGGLGGYYSKPWLKDGGPSDSFAKEYGKNLIESFGEDAEKEFKKELKSSKKIQKAKTLDEVKAICEKYSINFEEEFKGMDLDAIKAEVKEYMESSKQSFKEGAKEFFKEAYDSKAGKFVHDAEKLSQEGFSMGQKAAKRLQGRAALIYGAIAAGVLGAAGLIAGIATRKPAQEAPIPQAQEAPAETQAAA
ncbi:MAG: hypothetical protein LBK53_04990 [Heliobacteriaceae bacterium]|nr:hypothetical protein [Heliobacteriaceae bacterium]